MITAVKRPHLVPTADYLSDVEYFSDDTALPEEEVSAYIEFKPPKQREILSMFCCGGRSMRKHFPTWQ